MPLCPTCVVEHTEQHYECNQKPTYVNLNDALQESKQKCYSNIIKLEEFNRKNVVFRVNVGLAVELHTGIAGLYPKTTVRMQGEIVSFYRSEVLGIREQLNLIDKEQVLRRRSVQPEGM